MRHGRQPMCMVVSTVAGNPCPVLPPVPSAILLYCDGHAAVCQGQQLAELMRHDVLSEGREKEEAAECCRARLARDGGSVARPRPLAGNRSRSVVRGPRASRRIGRGQR